MDWGCATGADGCATDGEGWFWEAPDGEAAGHCCVGDCCGGDCCGGELISVGGTGACPGDTDGRAAAVPLAELDGGSAV